MKKNRQLGQVMTEGVIWKQLLQLFIPIFLGSLFQQLYNTVDMVIVGQFVGTQALASVGGSSGQMVGMVVGFFTGLSAGAGVIISQLFGAGDLKTLKRGISTAYAFSIAGGLMIMAGGILLSPAMLRLMNTPEEILQSSALYLRLYFAGILFVFIFNIGSGILRALGNTTLPLVFLAICSVVNIVLDLLLVVVFHMGVAGVALATLLAQAVSAVLVTRSLTRADPAYALDLRRIQADRTLLGKQLYLGLPSGFQSMMYSIANLLVQTAFNSFGTIVVAAASTDAKIEQLFWMISGAFGAALTTFVGQNYGAGRWDRIYKGTRICLLIDQAASVLISIILYSMADPLFHIFTRDPAVIETGISILRLVVPFYVGFSFVECLSSSLRATNNVLAPLFLTMFGVCILRIIWITIAMRGNPTLRVIIANYPVTWWTTAFLFIIYYLIRKRQRLQYSRHMISQ